MAPDEKLNILNRLNALELLQKNNLDEIEALKKFLLENPKLVKNWLDLEKVSGFYIDSFSKVESYENRPTTDENKNIFATEAQANSALAKAQLSQLMQSFASGWSTKLPNYCVFLQIVEGNLQPYFGHSALPQFLAFRSIEKAKAFYEAHKTLIHIYWSEFLE